MNETESEGKSVTEAVESALKITGLRRDQVEVEILQESSAGFMGFGTKLARVRIREKRWAADGSAAPAAASPAKPAPAQAPKVSPRNASRSTRGLRPAPRPQKQPDPNTARPRPPERAQRPSSERTASTPPPRGARDGEPNAAPPFAQRPRTPLPPREEFPPLSAEEAQKFSVEASELISEMLKLMSFSDARVEAAWDPVLERIQAKIETTESDRLIGRDGKTLESFQYLVTLALTRRSGRPLAVWVDTQGFWSDREKSILEQAQKGIEIVKSTGKSFRLAPMEAAMRRLVHRTLMNNPEVTTASEGEGSWRKIVLRPKQ